MWCSKYIVSVLAAFFWPACNAISISNVGVLNINLNGRRSDRIWMVEGQNSSTGRAIRIPAEVPGGIYSDLEASNLLASPIYHDFNDLESKWVGRTDWTYSRKFMVSEGLMLKGKIVLICEGLDTVATIYINGRLVGQSENMFVRYITNIKEYLQVGQNVIMVAFTAPVLYAYEEYMKHNSTWGYPVTPFSLVPEYRGENKAQMIRKMQASFSWDWGPSYASSGIWKDIYIQGFDSVVIRDVLIFTSTKSEMPDETEQTEWTFTARIFFDVAPQFERGVVMIRRAGEEVAGSARVRLSSNSFNIPHDITIIVHGNTTKLWWPNGYGKQRLYLYEICYLSERFKESSCASLKVGFRTVELIQDFVDLKKLNFGREFYFKVNGIQMYSKGSNSIPLHVLPEKVTKEQTKWLLQSAKELNINMLRVWGGGIYESDYFYDLADQLGIFIWQDFMFACAMYPATKEFLHNVVDEVGTQVKRLQHHASIALWAANNENEAALMGNWYQTYGLPEIYKRDYIKLYVDTIVNNVTFLDPTRECLSSSPTNGKQTELEGWVAKNPGDDKFGDIHHYDYYSDTWDALNFRRKPRFASEYGFQSFPYIESLRKVTSNLSAWSWNSAMAEHRQRHPNGQMELNNLIQDHLPYPKFFNSSAAFPAMIYMSQIVQSMSQKTQTEFYRRLMDKLETDGSGHNMGALYWQLNDIWEGCSWASFEVNGRWKMFANYIQKAFSPVLPSAYIDTSGEAVVELISDSLEPVSGTLQVRIYGLNSMFPIFEGHVQVEAIYLQSREILRISSEEMNAIGCGKQNRTSGPCIMTMTIPDVVDNFLLVNYPILKQHLKDPKLRVTKAKASPNSKIFFITLESQAVAPFVFLNLKEHTYGRFSDNGFMMVESPRTVKFYSRDPLPLEGLLQQLHIVSLYDVTSVA